MASNIRVDQIASSRVDKKFLSDTGIIFDLSTDNTYTKIPNGTIAQRGTPSDGAIRWNSELGVLEIYRSGLWRISRRAYKYNQINRASCALNLDAANLNCWPRNGNKWFNDGIGGYHGLLIGNPSFNTANGGFFDFSGTEYSTVEVTEAALQPTTGMTLECWFKVNNTNSKQTLIDLQYGISNNSAFTLYVDNSNWVGGVNILGTLETFSHPFTTTPLQTNQWYQLVYSYNGSNFTRTSTANLTTGNTVLTEVVNITDDVFVGMGVSGSGIVNDETTTTTITAIDYVAKTVTLSTAPTQTINGVNLTFTNPPSHYMYINGERVGTSAVAGDVDYNAVNRFITIAGEYDGPGDNTGITNRLNGSLASVRIYSAFQAKSTVQLNWNLLRSTFGL